MQIILSDALACDIRKFFLVPRGFSSTDELDIVMEIVDFCRWAVRF